MQVQGDRCTQSLQSWPQLLLALVGTELLSVHGEQDRDLLQALYKLKVVRQCTPVDTVQWRCSLRQPDMTMNELTLEKVLDVSTVAKCSVPTGSCSDTRILYIVKRHTFVRSARKCLRIQRALSDITNMTAHRVAWPLKRKNRAGNSLHGLSTKTTVTDQLKPT